MPDLNQPNPIEGRLRRELDRPAPGGPKARLLQKAAWRPVPAPPPPDRTPEMWFRLLPLLPFLVPLLTFTILVLFSAPPLVPRRPASPPLARPSAPVIPPRAPVHPQNPLVVAEAEDIPEETRRALSTQYLWESQPDFAMPFGENSPNPFLPNPAG